MSHLQPRCARHPHAILVAAILAAALIVSPTVFARSELSVRALRLIGEQRIPHRQSFQRSTVGGLSGIDYDPRADNWILASDDRSDFDASRFYKATLTYDEHLFKSVTLTSVTSFRQQNGHPYSSRWQWGEIADVESVRFDPSDSSIWYTSEGDRMRQLSPFIRRASRTGLFVQDLEAPAMFTMRRDQRFGSRSNLTLEGMTFARDGQSLWVAMEGPLWQDGSVPSPSAGSVTRITQYTRGGQMLRQVAYPVDAIPVAPAKGRFADNGVTEILAVDDERFLVVERSAVQDAAGRYSNVVRIYEMDASGATDVSGFESLLHTDFQPVAKRLVLDLTTLDLPKLDNIEGMAWGPTLANGRRSLVLVSDDNFNDSQVTQLLAFEVLLDNL